MFSDKVAHAIYFTAGAATFFTALTDFSDQGEFTPFLTDDFIDGIEAEIEDKGVLPSVIMARTFTFLRSNDLVYTPAIKSYMMGETPPAFDLLYWNGDGANLPAKMAMQYLRGLCQRNELLLESLDVGRDVGSVVLRDGALREEEEEGREKRQCACSMHDEAS